ncbi:MAG: CBS domain-containing protein [Saprospiraceae bacterium]|nr:CBS domain-containing protein [Bacteroidia bacterium]MBT8229406.1 CBS domain-containing protein [Bacteroidia bacterium]NNF22536.1 CBS domain-containing protein [Saprospiraceae bacterium]NNK89591.1 CBS domain-containing protein [Saprospiraceae bacterium]
MMNEQVRRIMTKDPLSVTQDMSVLEAEKIMLKNRMNQLVVVDGIQFVGLITAYDLWRDDRESDNHKDKKVADVMNTKVCRITPLDKVGTAAELFMDKRFKTLPVVNLRGELKGVITSFDVLRHCLTEEYPRPILYQEVFENQ